MSNGTIWTKIKKIFTSVITVIGTIFAAIGSIFVIKKLRGDSGEDVSDFGIGIGKAGNTADRVSGELDESADDLRKFEESIESQLSGLERIEGRIEHSEELINELGAEISQQHERVRECQSILESVRNRGEQSSKE